VFPLAELFDSAVIVRSDKKVKAAQPFDRDNPTITYGFSCGQQGFVAGRTGVPPVSIFF
jgi:hypothetical protein